MISCKTSQPLGWLSLSAVSLMLAAPISAEPPATTHSQWVYPDHSGKLVYQQLKTGDRISDFSYAGYGGGGVALPIFPVKKTVAPSGEDDTASIQAAIDEVSNLPPPQRRTRCGSAGKRTVPLQVHAQDQRRRRCPPRKRIRRDRHRHRDDRRSSHGNLSRRPEQHPTSRYRDSDRRRLCPIGLHVPQRPRHHRPEGRRQSPDHAPGHTRVAAPDGHGHARSQRKEADLGIKRPQDRAHHRRHHR